MKREILICVCALTVIASTTDSIYACCEKPVADFSAPSDICIDCEVGFDASGSYDPDNTDLTYDWNFGSGAYDEDVSDPVHPTCKYSTAGVKTVILEVTDDDDPGCCGGDPNCHDKKSDPNAVETVTVVRVDKVVENVSPFTNEGPLDTCIDESISLLAFAYPPSGSFPADEPHWSIESQPADANATLTPSTGSSLTNLGNMTKAGNYVIKAQCGDSDDGDTITVIADGWEANPAISGAAIKKSHDQEWFHISQSCDLKAKGYDADTKCDTEYDDYIRLDLTEWSGSPDLSSTVGETVTWDPEEPTSTSGVTITATIKDDPDLPDGSNTDDGDTSASKVLKAYEAAADLTVNWANSEGSGNVTTTLFETGPFTDSISKNMNDSESVSVDASTLPVETTGTDSSFFEPQEPFVKGKWTLKLNPSTAPLDAPGKIKVSTDVDVSGTLECTVDDEDPDLWGCDVSIGVTIPGPLSISISPDLDTSGDTCEAQAALSWGYDSEIGLSRASPLSEELEKSSGDGTGTFQQTFSYAPDSQDFVGEKVETMEALAKVGGKIEAKGWHEWRLDPISEMMESYYWDASASMACTGSSVTYYIDLPTVQNPAYWPAEEGYWD